MNTKILLVGKRPKDVHLFQFVKRSLFVLILAVLFLTTNAQKNPYNEVSIASPTAGSLGKYADIPVNKHTGIPGIGVPVHIVKEGSLELPISLSYHAGGLKVMEPASWIGAGWSLNAGGVITRTVRGAPDEKGTSSVYNQVHGYFSDYGYSSYSYYQLGTLEADYFIEGKADGEPDLFSFNFGNFSGKFYFRDDRTPVFEPQQDIKVEYDYTYGSGSIKSFILTSPDGIRYHFGTKNDPSNAIPVERTNPVTEQSGYVQGTVISSWYLSKIESADGLNSIKLNYQPETYAYYTLSMFPIPGDSTSHEYSLIKNIVSGVRLDSISFSNGRINFMPGTARQDLANGSTSLTPEIQNTEAKRLDTIQITNREGFCKNYLFSYDYFTDNTPLQGYFANYGIQSDTKRLKLIGIQEQSCDGSLNTPAHTFEYFSEPVPRRLSFGQDHWGFSNGVTNNTKLLPTYTVNEFDQHPGANRDAAWPAMRGGALKRINYPTGGYSDFEFEANSTWASSTGYSNVYRFYLYIGYGSSTNPAEQYQTLSANPYILSLSNNASLTGMATVSVYNSSNTLVQSLSANLGESKSVTFKPGSGTYRITLSKNGSIGSNGVTASFSEKMPYTFERNEMVGGLRIKTLTHNDGNQNTVTSYGYAYNNGHSTGVLYSRPVYVQVIRNDEIKEAGTGGPYGNQPPNSNNCNPTGCLSCDFGNSLFFYKSPAGIRPLASSQGNHIGYNEVEVSQSGNGYSKYLYYGSDRWDAELNDVAIRNVTTTPPCSINIPNYPDAPLPFEPKRGEPKAEWHYNESSQPLKQITFYHTFAEEPVATPGRISANVFWRFSTYYETKAIKKTETSAVETVYAPAAPNLTATTQTFFESLYHYQPTRTLTIDSRGENLEKKFRYAADFRVGNCDASACYQDYQTAISTHIMNYNIAKNSCSTSGCVWNNYQTYRANLAQARRDLIACLRGSFADSQLRFAICRNGAKSTANAELKPIIELQELNDFTPIEATSWKGGKLVNASFNRFDYAANPVGKVFLNKTQLLSLAAPSATFVHSAITGNDLIKDGRYNDETTLKFDNGNLVELTKKDGVVTSYIWGYNRQYPVAKVVGASFDAVHAVLTQSVIESPSSDAALRIELNNLRTNLPSAFVTTYTYKKGVGITSETDANGRTMYYEYDGLGKLAYVRDKDNHILKKICYNYQGQPEDCSSGCTTTTANWQNTTTPVRCKLDGSYQNTGEEEQEQRDMNPCSITYNQTQWVSIGYNTAACPPPSTCNYSNCYYQGPQYNCVYGNCEQGFKVYTASYYDYESGWVICVYHYEWSDGSWSGDYQEYSPGYCFIN